MTVFDYETLTKLGARLFDPMPTTASPTSPRMRWRSTFAWRRAPSPTLRPCDFRVAEIAEAALTQRGRAIHRDLLAALADAEF